MAVGEPRAAAAAGSHAAELDSARLGVGDSTQEPKADAALDRTQMRRKERRVSELWAYALLHEDGDTLRQPCTVPLVDDLPRDLRERLCTRMKYEFYIAGVSPAEQRCVVCLVDRFREIGVSKLPVTRQPEVLVLRRTVCTDAVDPELTRVAVGGLNPPRAIE